MRSKIKNILTEIAFLIVGSFIGAAINSMFPFVICLLIGWIVIIL